MTINVNEMTFSQMEELIQMKESELNVLKVEYASRRQQIIDDFKLNVAHVLEKMNMLKEMGIEPDSVCPEIKEILRLEPQFVEEQTSDEPVEETGIELAEEVQNVEERPASDPELEENLSETEPLEPFYKIWGDVKLHDGKTKKKRKESSPIIGKMTKFINPFFVLWERIKPNAETPQTNNRQNNLITPFYEYFSNKPIKKIIKLGNEKFRDSYPDPEEGRIMSADGICCTLTRMHSDFLIIIPPRIDSEKIEAA